MRCLEVVESVLHHFVVVLKLSCFFIRGVKNLQILLQLFDMSLSRPIFLIKLFCLRLLFTQKASFRFMQSCAQALVLHSELISFHCNPLAFSFCCTKVHKRLFQFGVELFLQLLLLCSVPAVEGFNLILEIRLSRPPFVLLVLHQLCRILRLFSEVVLQLEEEIVHLSLDQLLLFLQAILCCTSSLIELGNVLCFHVPHSFIRLLQQAQTGVFQLLLVRVIHTSDLALEAIYHLPRLLILHVSLLRLPLLQVVQLLLPSCEGQLVVGASLLQLGDRMSQRGLCQPVSVDLSS
mmetsp:Transcript_30657/g.98655  ORF Transcript_30657/g.98655 Transcript_30657/m.98655 type:complete len:292 (-) Transcript_30657:904-1779(-)